MQNEMMHRPIVKPEIVEYMRTKQRKLTGQLYELEEHAHEKGVPVIPHETVMFLQVLLDQLKPKQILEIGTAIGFSSALMSQFVGDDGHVTTIDRYDLMIASARENYEKMGLNDKITLLEGDAAEILPTLDQTFDFIFMDSAKAKYIEFLPYCMNVLKTGGMLVVDDILQAGTILSPIEEIPRKNRSIHRKLNLFLDTVMANEGLLSSIVPLGDGLILITKTENYNPDSLKE